MSSSLLEPEITCLSTTKILDSGVRHNDGSQRLATFAKKKLHGIVNLEFQRDHAREGSFRESGKVVGLKVMPRPGLLVFLALQIFLPAALVKINALEKIKLNKVLFFAPCFFARLTFWPGEGNNTQAFESTTTLKKSRGDVRSPGRRRVHFP